MSEGSEEARVFSRHLVGHVVPPELLARYDDGCRALFTEPMDRTELAIVEYAVAHPASVGPLDAASALRRPAGALRARLLLMSAVLETSPRYADAFLPADVGPLRLVGRLAVDGTVAVLQAVVGLVLLARLTRTAR